MNRYREILSGYDISAFPKLREKDVKALEDTLSIDIPTLVKQVQKPLPPWKSPHVCQSCCVLSRLHAR